MDKRECKVTDYGERKNTIPKKGEVIAVGPSISDSQKFVNGQAMMFQLLVDSLIDREWKVNVYDTSEQAGIKSRASGSFSWSRIADYTRILPKLWSGLLSKPNIVYLSIAQSGIGFIRDLSIIVPASILRLSIVAHQFGGGYEAFYIRQNYFIKWMIRFSFSRLRVLIVEGEQIKRSFSFIHDWEDKVVVIQNGLPERSLQLPSQGKSINSSSQLELIFLSNMIETKGYWDVIEAVRILTKERNRDVHCQFSGKFLAAADSKRFDNPADAREAFLNYIEKHNMKKNISYTEGLYGDDKAKAFHKSNIFLLPSNYLLEGQPVSVLEALAYGLVVIATNYRLLPMMVDDTQTGFLVEYNQPEQIANKIELLMDDPCKYKEMSENSMEKYYSQFSANKYVNSMEDIFTGFRGVIS